MPATSSPTATPGGSGTDAWRGCCPRCCGRCTPTSTCRSRRTAALAAATDRVVACACPRSRGRSGARRRRPTSTTGGRRRWRCARSTPSTVAASTPSTRPRCTTPPRPTRLFRARGPVVDVQTHLVDPVLWHGPHAAALGHFLRMVDPERWPDAVDPHAIDAAAWAALVFGASETAVALLTSTPGPAGENVLENAQIAAVRDVTDRYAGYRARADPHDRAPEPRAGRARPDGGVVARRCGRRRGRCTRSPARRPRRRPPADGSSTTPRSARRSSNGCAALGPRIVCAHKGLGGPVPDASVAAASPRDIGPAAAAFPDIDFVVYHSGYERDPRRRRGGVRPDRAERRRPAGRVGRARTASAPGGNV